MKNSFLTILEYSLIPSIQSMVDAETKHLSYLKGIKGLCVDKFIQTSETSLEQLTKSLQEYKTYLKDNKNDNKPNG